MKVRNEEIYKSECYHYFKAIGQACVFYYELGLINPESADEFKPAMRAR
jgi:hypothetical protein